MIGHLELIIILVVVFLIFGAKRLPDIAKSIGKGIREFRKALDGREAGEEKGQAPADGSAPSAPDGKPEGKEGGNAPAAPEKNAPSAPEKNAPAAPG